MSIYQFNKKTSAFVKEHQTMGEAAKAVKSSKKEIAKVLDGKRDSIRGYSFIVNPKEDKPQPTDENELSYYMKRKLAEQHHSPTSVPNDFTEDCNKDME